MFNNSKKEPDEHLKSPNLQAGGNRAIELPNLPKLVLNGSQMILSNYQMNLQMRGTTIIKLPDSLNSMMNRNQMNKFPIR